jgi:hypothetical protein
MTFNFITYMRSCAETLKDIGHTEQTPKFFRISGLLELDEVLSNLSDMGFPAMLVHDNTEGVIADRAPSDNYLDTPYYVFYIVQHVSYADHDAQELAKAQCKTIALKILARMLRDKKRGKNGLTFLQFNNIPYQGIGPIGDNCHGVMFTFQVPDSANLIYNADDWNT